MNIKELLESITSKRVGVGAIVFVSLIGPPYLALYNFNLELLKSWGLGNTLLFCGALAIPSVLMWALMLAASSSNDELKQEEHRERLFLAAAGGSALLQYMALVWTLETAKPTFRLFVYLNAAAHGAMLIFGTVHAWWDRRRRKKSAVAANVSITITTNAASKTVELPVNPAKQSSIA